MRFTAACPNCRKELEIECEGAPQSGMRVTCDHCGVEKRLSAFQREYSRHQQKIAQQAQRAEAERQKQAHTTPSPPAPARVPATPVSPPRPSPGGPVPSHKDGIPCHTCGAGILIRRAKHRMSGPVVVIGYILLIPSVIGIVISVLMLFASGGATKTTVGTVKTETKRSLVNAGVPHAIADRVLAFEHISHAELSRLSEEQRSAVESAELSLSAATVGAGVGGALVGGSSICFGISAFVGGLLGWLLVMKKKVLQCNSCGSVVAAS